MDWRDAEFDTFWQACSDELIAMEEDYYVSEIKLETTKESNNFTKEEIMNTMDCNNEFDAIWHSCGDELIAMEEDYYNTKEIYIFTKTLEL